MLRAACPRSRGWTLDAGRWARPPAASANRQPPAAGPPASAPSAPSAPSASASLPLAASGRVDGPWGEAVRGRLPWRSWCQSVRRADRVCGAMCESHGRARARPQGERANEAKQPERDVPSGPAGPAGPVAVAPPRLCLPVKTQSSTVVFAPGRAPPPPPAAASGS